MDGTPADCVRLALDHLTPGVDWVLSGINAGGNLGADVYHSGTVAAVREGVLHGVPGIALSHYIAAGRVDRLAPRVAVGGRGPPPAAGHAAGPGRVLEREFPPPRPGRARPRHRLLPAGSFPLAADLSRRGGPGGLHRQLPLASPPAAQRRRRLLRRPDRRDLGPGLRGRAADRIRSSRGREPSVSTISWTSAHSPGETSAAPDCSAMARPSAAGQPRTRAMAAAAMHGERLMPAPQMTRVRQSQWIRNKHGDRLDGRREAANGDSLVRRRAGNGNRPARGSPVPGAPGSPGRRRRGSPAAWMPRRSRTSTDMPQPELSNPGTRRTIVLTAVARGRHARSPIDPALIGSPTEQRTSSTGFHAILVGILQTGLDRLSDVEPIDQILPGRGFRELIDDPPRLILDRRRHGLASLALSAGTRTGHAARRCTAIAQAAPQDQRRHVSRGQARSDGRRRSGQSPARRQRNRQYASSRVVGPLREPI